MKLKIALTLVALSLLGLACIPAPSVTFTPSGSAMLDCYGNITPCSNMTYDIGRADRYFGTIYVSNVIGWMPLGGTGTVTATGTSAGHIPYFAAPFDLQNSSMYYSNMTGYIGIFDNTPGTQLDVTGQIHATGDINSDSDVNSGNDLNCVNDLNVTDDADIGGNLRMAGVIQPASMADGSAPNNSIYFSTTSGKLAYKDSLGVVHDLY